MGKCGEIMMHRARLVAQGKIELEEVQQPTPAQKEVLIRVAYAGICGSDVHAYLGKHPFVKPPIVLGHEVSGIIEDSKDGRFQIGEKVTIEPSVTCGHCYNCLQGRYNICQELRVIGCAGYDGGYAEFIVVPGNNVIHLPTAWHLKRGALVEPTAVAVHAVKLSRLKRGEPVVVFGAGTIGLLTVAVAKAFGAGETCVVDLLDSRLKIAEGQGATLVINPQKLSLDKTLPVGFSGGVGVILDSVVDELTIGQGFAWARNGARVVIIGIPASKIRVDMALVQDHEFELIGSLLYTREDYEVAIRLLDNGSVNADQLITDIYPLSRAAEALASSKDRADHSVKTLLDCT